MSQSSSGQIADGSKVRPQRDKDSAIVAPDRSRGLGLPPPGRHRRCLARVARGDPRRHSGDGQGCVHGDQVRARGQSVRGSERPVSISRNEGWSTLPAVG
jgi:hypothetical protein